MRPESATPLRLALLGAGTFPSTAHFDALKPLCDANRAKIVFVWSRSESSASSLAAKYGQHVKYYHVTSNTDSLESARSVIEQNRQQIDAVVLSLPIQQLASFSQMILEQKLHLLAEKPLAANVAEAKQLLQSVSHVRPNVLHAVAENFRFEPVFRAMRSAVREVCGKVIGMTLIAQVPQPVGSKYARGWRLQLTDTGMLSDGAVHFVAGLRVVAGEDIVRVQARCENHGDHFQGCDTGSAVLEFQSGLVANFYVSYACKHFHWQIRVTGTEGDVVAERIPRTGYDMTGNRGYTLTVTGSDGKKQVSTHGFGGIEGEFTAFVDSCSTGKLHPDLEAVAAFNDMATTEAMFESSKTDRKVSVAKYE